MKISGIFRKFFCQAVIDLVKECRNRFITLVFNGDFCLFQEGHGKIGIKTSGWIDCYWKGIDTVGYAKSTAEKVSQRAFHGRGFFPVPVHAQHQISQNIPVAVTYTVRHCDPDMIDRSRAIHFCQGYRFSRFDFRNTGRTFSGSSQITGRSASHSLFSLTVFPVNTSALSFFQY